MNKKAIRNATIITIISFIISSFLLYNITNSEITDKKNETKALLNNQAVAIKNEFIIIEERLRAIKAFIIGNKGSFQDVDKVTGYILEQKNIRNMLIAPNSIVEKVYPLEENEDVLGLDLTCDKNASKDEALLAIKSKDVVFSDPYQLAQGGEAISGRLAIYLKDEQGQEYYWGIISITVNFPDIIEYVSTNFLENSNFLFSLQRKDSNGKYYTLLTNSKDLDDYTNVDFNIRNANFRFYAKPKNGWLDSSTLILYVITLMLVSIILGIIAGIFFVTRYRLIEKASRDKLTGLYNREGSLREINDRLKIGKFKHGALLLMDIDHFKSVNDTMGHPKGDEVLIETADILLRSCRSMDIVSRLGGDEFTVFFSFDKKDNFVEDKAEYIRQSMERIISDGTNEIKISSSIGISFLCQDIDNFEKLYKSADLALYESKENGRNKITIYKEED